MKIPWLLLAATVAAPAFAQDRRPGPACAPFLEGTVRSTDPRRENKKTACANEIAVNAANTYSIAIRVYALGQGRIREYQETLRKEAARNGLDDIVIKAVVDTFTDQAETDILKASLQAEFGNPCERFDGWSGTEFIDNISRVACLIAMDAKRFPKEGERFESHVKSLVAAGTIPSEDSLGKNLQHTDAAIRFAFGYEEIDPARRTPSRTSKRRSVPTKIDMETESGTSGTGAEPSTPSASPASSQSSSGSPGRIEPPPSQKPGILASVWRWIAGDPQTGTFGRVVNGVMFIGKVLLALLALGLMIGPLYKAGAWLGKIYLDLLNWMFKLTLKDNNRLRVLISRWRDRLQDRPAPASPSGSPHAAPAPAEPPPPQHAL